MARKLSRRALLWGLGATGAVGLSGVLWRARTTWERRNPSRSASHVLSGVVAAWGRAGRQGLKMAVEELNGQGGVLGRQLVMKAEDDTVNGEVAVRKARRLVLGWEPTCSSVSMPAGWLWPSARSWQS